jgi:hypothetical protein
MDQAKKNIGQGRIGEKTESRNAKKINAVAKLISRFFGSRTYPGPDISDSGSDPRTPH